MRKSRIIMSSIIVLGIFGVFFNLAYVVQDVSWFVWTYPGSHTGLFGVAKPSDPLYISPAVLWTFEHSQLTQSIITAFQHLQPDIFLLKLLGPTYYVLTLTSILGMLVFLLIRTFRNIKKKIYDGVATN